MTDREPPGKTQPMLPSCPLRSPCLRLCALAVALLFAALMVIGVWRHYSAVPALDMWDAYLGFYTRAGTSWRAWWEQHNEHRLIVSRLLFWTDLRLFGGSMILLFALNAIFALLVAGGFVFLLRHLWPRHAPPNAALSARTAQTALAALLTVLATSWLQHENFTWAFQSQFWLAYLLPLLAFTLLSHARATGRHRYFWLAWLAGWVSAGTMANGTLTLPLLVAQALFLRLRWRDVAVLLLTAALVLGLYLHGYQTTRHIHAPQGMAPIIEHSQVLFVSYDVLGQHGAARWLHAARYTLLFLGGPWYFALQTVASQVPLWPAMAAGAAWIGLALTMGLRVLRRWRRDPASPYAVALLALMAYLGAAALGAAHGRAMLGMEQALSSRYLTPQLMAWSAALVLGAHLWPRAAASRWTLGGYAVIALLLLPAQWRGAWQAPDDPAGPHIPALAVQLGVRDFQRINQMSYEGERTFALAAQARREHLAVFGEPDMRLALRYWSGQIALPHPPARCAGRIDSIETIASTQALLQTPGLPRETYPSVPDVMRVRGWLYDPQRRQVPSLVTIAGAEPGYGEARDDGRALGQGVALTGFLRLDVARALRQPTARASGFEGYLQTPALTDGAVTLTGWLGQQPVCAITLDLPR